MDIKSSRVRLNYGLRTAGVSRATWYRKCANHPLAPEKRVEPCGSPSFDRKQVDRFVNAIKKREV
jgi:hypothetical protein